MSKELSKTVATQFDSEVKQAYQDTGRLRETVRVKRLTDAATHQFQVMGRGVASKRTPQSEITPMNVGHENVQVTVEDWQASEYTDIFDDAKTKVDERQELSFTIGKALSRREDQLIIDALENPNDSITQTVSDDIGGTDSGLNISKLRETKKIFDQNGINVQDSDISFLVNAAALQDLLSETELTSADYNTVRSLVRGEIDTFMGFEFVLLGDRPDEGGLPSPSSNKRHLWAYDRQAVGLAESRMLETQVDWIANRSSWLAQGHLQANAVTIDEDGIVEITIDES